MLIPGINGAHKHPHRSIQTLTFPLLHIGIKYTLLNTQTQRERESMAGETHPTAVAVPQAQLRKECRNVQRKTAESEYNEKDSLKTKT